MFSNNYDPFDDFFGPSYFSSPYDRRRRQELARRQEIEAARRRKVELERRKLMELERAKEERRRELEMMRRQQQMMKEEEMRRKKLAQAQQQRGGRYAPGTIVLGPDGNLYRVISAPTNDDERLHSGEESSSHKIDSIDNDQLTPVGKKRFSASDESKENFDEQMTPAEENKLFHQESETSSESEESIDDVCASHTHEDHFYDAESTYPATRRPEEVQVEDVPDEEDEELRELHSIWRNRSPSPGQWMEPIE